MENKQKKIEKNQVLKALGSILMALALLFILKKILEMDIDYKSIFNGYTIAASILISVAYGLIIIIFCWPWRNYIEMITGVRLPYTETAYVMAKANLLKYVPGNVFQYIGRNEVAINNKLQHSKVGMATILEIATNFLAATLLGISFYFDGFQIVVVQFKKELIVIVSVGIIISLTIVFFVWYKKRAVLEKYLDIFSCWKNIKIVFKNLLFFAINALLNAGLYILTLTLILNMRFDLQDIHVLIGAYILAWTVGFVIPGAPGGIGIREFVMTLLLPGYMDIQMILLGLVLYRFINILGDILGFLFAGVLRSAHNSRMIIKE